MVRDRMSGQRREEERAARTFQLGFVRTAWRGALLATKRPGAALAPGLFNMMKAKNKSGLVEIVLQATAAAGVAQLAQRLRLDLADALARDPELPAHLL